MDRYICLIASVACSITGVLMLDYDLESRGELSLYEFVYRSIRRDIEAGTLAPHEKLPSKRAFAQHLGVSLITVENAYAQLVTEGYCYTRPRSGYYVSELSAVTSVTKRDKSAPATFVTLPDEAHPDVRHDLSRVDADPAMVSRVWGRALRRVLSVESDEELYGPQPPKGTLRLRHAIAHKLRETRGFEADPACIVVGAGSQLLDAALVQLLQPRGSVALENPGYPRLAQIYESAGLSVRSIGLDNEGMSMEELRASDASLVHVMPSHQFPTGIVTSISRRYELLAWASETEGRYIVEDDYDAPFRMAGRPVASLASIDVAGHVIYTNTFSKSLGPALRMAFMVLPPRLAEAWEERVGFYANTVIPLDQLALARFIEQGHYDRHVNRMRTHARKTQDALVNALREAFGGRVAFAGLNDGLHFIMQLESERSERELAVAAEAAGIRIAPLSNFAGTATKTDAMSTTFPARFILRSDSVSAEETSAVASALAKAWA